MQTHFQIGAAVVANKFLLILGSNSILWPGEAGTVLEVDEDTGGLLVQFESYPNAIGIFPDDVGLDCKPLTAAN